MQQLHSRKNASAADKAGDFACSNLFKWPTFHRIRNAVNNGSHVAHVHMSQVDLIRKIQTPRGDVDV